MHVIAFVTQKGGTGKSTLALNLGVTAMSAGEKVAVVDLDPQGTAISWRQSRTAAGPEVARSEGSIEATLARLASEGVTVALVDTPGTETSRMREMMQAADLCLVPIRPSEADVRATMPTLKALAEAGRPYCLVINQAPARLVARPPDGGEKGDTVLPVVVGARVDHQYAYALGLGVAEYAPSGKAAQEMSALWDAVRGRLAASGQSEMRLSA